MDALSIRLPYGYDQGVTLSVDATRLALHHSEIPSVPDVLTLTRRALASPLEAPGIAQSLVPGDRIVIALDADTPGKAEIVSAIWEELSLAEIEAEDVIILQPASLRQGTSDDPRERLPGDVAEAMQWKLHDPTEGGSCQYLAATSEGETIYLAREVVDADFVILVGPYRFDPLLGYRGGASVVYPNLSNVEAIRSARGQGHDELMPQDVRPLRQTIDEVSWLLGTQFVIGVVPGSSTGVAQIFAGQIEAVTRKALSHLNEFSIVRAGERADTVIVAVEADAAGHGWEQLGAALDVARRLVTRDGRIIALTELDVPLTEGIDRVRQSRLPRDAVRPLRQQLPQDVVPATQLAQALDWANVALRSKLPADTVEDLFMLPLESDEDIARALDTSTSCMLVASAQHKFGLCERDVAADDAEED